MKWVTRERPKIDRIACPWLIKRFIEEDAEFLYVPADKVLATAQSTGQKRPPSPLPVGPATKISARHETLTRKQPAAIFKTLAFSFPFFA